MLGEIFYWIFNMSIAATMQTIVATVATEAYLIFFFIFRPPIPNGVFQAF